MSQSALLMREKALIILVILLIIILVSWRATLLDQLELRTDELVILENKRDLLHKQNLLIREKILLNSSLTTIKQKAAEEGFINSTYYVLK